MIRMNIGLCTGNERKFGKKRDGIKKKVESHFTYSNMRRVWSGMKLMSRYVNGNTQTIALVNAAGEVNELNQFFNRFVCHDFSRKHRQSYVLNRASAEEDDFQRPCHFMQSHIHQVHAYLV